eukprot:UN04188
MQCYPSPSNVWDRNKRMPAELLVLVGMTWGSFLSSIVSIFTLPILVWGTDHSARLDVNNVYHLTLIIISFLLCPCYLFKCVGEFTGHTFSNETMQIFSIFVYILNMYQLYAWGYLLNDNAHNLIVEGSINWFYYCLVSLYIQLVIFIMMIYQFHKQFNYNSTTFINRSIIRNK